MKNAKRLLALAVSAALAAPMAAHATNGMNLEGYGPIATGMGGASMAYDNGTAAMMNNPSTLGLMSDGSRLDLAIGIMGPSVASNNTSGSVSSDAKSFMMPAMGYAKKNGGLAYGVGMFAQGGMGAEYAGGSAVDQTGAAGISMTGAPNSDSQQQRSELGVGRLIFPVSYGINDKLTVGGSIDFVWGGMDILWSMDARNFLGAMSPGAGADPAKAAALGGMIGSTNDRAVASGSLIDTFVSAFDTTGGVGAPNGYFNNFYWGSFKFSDSNSFTQATKGTGFGGKLGFNYKASDKLSVGGTYHSKTAMSDLTGDIEMTFKVDTTALGGSVSGAEIDVAGTVKVKDFQWPETYGLGVAFKPSDKLMIAADWKRLNWASVMKDFHMVITAAPAASQVGMATFFGDTVLDFVYPQNWKNQDVIQLGATYMATDALALRVGYNSSSNPVPDTNLNFLFPATITSQYTVGFGYDVSKASAVNFSLTHAPEVSATESVTESNNLGVTPATTVTHSQTNYQLMYSYKF